MKVTVKLFAFLGDQLGPAVTISISEPTVTAVKAAVIKLDPAVATTVEQSRVALDQEFVENEDLDLGSDSELALIPPVSGG